MKQITNFHSLRASYLKACKGKSFDTEVLQFEQKLEYNLYQLHKELHYGTYNTGNYNKFLVWEPKCRIVAALPFRDRIVHHSLVARIEPIWEKQFIHHSYACRKGKGIHAGVDTVQDWLRKFPKPYVLKSDISKYFHSIDHSILLRLLSNHISDHRVLSLCEHILSSWTPGLPLGNLTSQLWANIYLHELDFHVKQYIGAKYYMRYMDDFVIVHDNKKELHDIRKFLGLWLESNLKIKLHRKTQVFPVDYRCLDFLGYRIWPEYRKLRKNSVNNMRKKLKHLVHQYQEGSIDIYKVRNVIQSWIGHAKHADSYLIRKKLLGSALFSRAA